MLRDAGVRTKLLAVLAIPTLLLVAATSLLVGGQVTAARRAGQVNALTDVAIQVNRVVHSLQEERSATLGYLQDPGSGNEARMQGQRQFTDQQLRSLRQLVAESPVAQMAAAIQAAVVRSAAGHDELASARGSIDAGRFFTTETDVFYTRVIRTDLDLPGVIAPSGTSALAQRLQAYEAVSTAIEYASHERDIVETALLRGSLTEADFAQSAALVSETRGALADFQRNADAATYGHLDDQLAAAQNFEIDQVRRDLPDLLKGRDPNIGRSVAWVGSANSRIAPMTETESDVVTDIATVAADTRSQQGQRALLLVVAAFLGLGLALMLAVALARRITRPLRRLTVAAGEIGAELPRMVERMQTPGDGPGVVVEPIPVESSDEIGRLAEAFNTVNDVTVQVAREQAALRSSIAEMFVNVARRNQVLLGRQLSQLDQMEAREEDPDVLDSLFKLDHLSTRMRRNAESLLVLAGIDSTRRLRRPLPLSDVIRTAVGEIEAFDRIDLSMQEDPDVSGRHALTVAHLLAELLENATHFSNPETRVVVSASVTGHGVDLTVTDYGLGMSEEEVAESNDKIAHPPVAEIAVSQRLGLFVVGRLAARLGASVVLRRGRAAGLVVAAALPAAVFESMAVEAPVGDELVTPALGADVLPDDAAPRIVVAPADALGVVTDPAAVPALPALPTAEPVSVGSSPLPPSALPAPGEAMVPEVAAASTGALPSRRSAAPVAEAATVAEPVTAELPPAAATAPLAEPAYRPFAETEAAAVVDAPAEPVAVPVPEHGGRRTLFAQWSRPPAGVGTGPAAEDETADAVEAFDPDGADQLPADDELPAVELLAVETPEDELSVELEVEMVALADEALQDDVDQPAGEAFDEVAGPDIAEGTEDAPTEAVVGSEPVPGSRRRGLFARWSRTPSADEPAAEIEQDVESALEPELEAVPEVEPVTETAPEAELVAELEPPVVEPVAETAPEAEPVAELESPAVEPSPDAPAAAPRTLFSRRGRKAARLEPTPEPEVAPVADLEPDVEPVAAAELVAEPEPPVVEPVAETAPEAELVAEPEPAVEPAVEESPDAPAAAPRTLFSRRGRKAARLDPTPEPTPAPDVEPVAEPAPEAEPQHAIAELEAVVVAEPVPAPVVERDSFATAQAEPVAEPEPVRPPVTYAKAVDILPVRSSRAGGGGLFGRHRKAAPERPAEPVRRVEAEPVAVASAPEPPAALVPVAPEQPAVPAPPVAAGPTAVVEPVGAEPVLPARHELTDDLFGSGIAASPAPAASPTPVVDGPPQEAAVVPLVARPATAQVPPVPAVVGLLPSRTPPATVEEVGPAPSADFGRMAARAEMHQSALSELRGLYEPSFAPPAPVPAAAPAGGLTRRTPKAAEEAAAEQAAPPPARTRTAAEVRGMLSGFRAGVERGRGSATDDQAAASDSDSPTR